MSYVLQSWAKSKTHKNLLVFVDKTTTISKLPERCLLFNAGPGALDTLRFEPFNTAVYVSHCVSEEDTYAIASRYWDVTYGDPTRAPLFAKVNAWKETVRAKVAELAGIARNLELVIVCTKEQRDLLQKHDALVNLVHIFDTNMASFCDHVGAVKGMYDAAFVCHGVTKEARVLTEEVAKEVWVEDGTGPEKKGLVPRVGDGALDKIRLPKPTWILNKDGLHITCTVNVVHDRSLFEELRHLGEMHQTMQVELPNVGGDWTMRFREWRWSFSPLHNHEAIATWTLSFLSEADESAFLKSGTTNPTHNPPPSPQPQLHRTHFIGINDGPPIRQGETVSVTLDGKTIGHAREVRSKLDRPKSEEGEWKGKEGTFEAKEQTGAKRTRVDKTSPTNAEHDTPRRPRHSIDDMTRTVAQMIWNETKRPTHTDDALALANEIIDTMHGTRPTPPPSVLRWAADLANKETGSGALGIDAMCAAMAFYGHNHGHKWYDNVRFNIARWQANPFDLPKSDHSPNTESTTEVPSGIDARLVVNEETTVDGTKVVASDLTVFPLVRQSESRVDRAMAAVKKVEQDDDITMAKAVDAPAPNATHCYNPSPSKSSRSSCRQVKADIQSALDRGRSANLHASVAKIEVGGKEEEKGVDDAHAPADDGEGQLAIRVDLDDWNLTVRAYRMGNLHEYIYIPFMNHDGPTIRTKVLDVIYQTRRAREFARVLIGGGENCTALYHILKPITSHGYTPIGVMVDETFPKPNHTQLRLFGEYKRLGKFDSLSDAEIEKLVPMPSPDAQPESTTNAPVDVQPPTEKKDGREGERGGEGDGWKVATSSPIDGPFTIDVGSTWESNFTHVRTLEEFDGPILTEHLGKDGKVYIEKWCTYEGQSAQFLLVRSSPEAIVKYLGGHMTMLELLTKPNSDIGFLVVHDGVKITGARHVQVSTLPSHYLPSPDTKHDKTLRKSTDDDIPARLLDKSRPLEIHADFDLNGLVLRVYRGILPRTTIHPTMSEPFPIAESADLVKETIRKERIGNESVRVLVDCIGFGAALFDSLKGMAKRENWLLQPVCFGSMRRPDEPSCREAVRDRAALVTIGTALDKLVAEIMVSAYSGILTRRPIESFIDLVEMHTAHIKPLAPTKD